MLLEVYNLHFQAMNFSSGYEQGVLYKGLTFNEIALMVCSVCNILLVLCVATTRIT